MVVASKLNGIGVGAVKPRARRIALDRGGFGAQLTSRTFSIDGTASMISSASSLSASVVVPKLVPRAAASTTAAVTRGSAVPQDLHLPAGLHSNRARANAIRRKLPE